MARVDVLLRGRGTPEELANLLRRVAGRIDCGLVHEHSSLERSLRTKSAVAWSSAPMGGMVDELEVLEARLTQDVGEAY